MSKEVDEFFSYLSMISNIHITRNTRKSITDEEKDELYKLKTAKTLEEACKILVPVYLNYKKNPNEISTEDKKRSVSPPKELVDSIYYVIFNQCLEIYKAERQIFKNILETAMKTGQSVDVLLKNHARETNTRKIEMLSEDACLRKRQFLAISKKVFKALEPNIKNPESKREKMGIRPEKDFFMMYFKSVNLFSSERKGRTFIGLIRTVLSLVEYPMIVDLTGDVTIFEDIFYTKHEFICCRNINVACFYYTVANKYKDLCQELEELIGECDIDELKDWKNEILEREKQETIKEFEDFIDSELLDKLVDKADNTGNILLYPLTDEIEEEITFASKYLFLRLYARYKIQMADDEREEETLEKFKEMLEENKSDLFTKLKWLSLRLRNVNLVCGGLKSLLEEITQPNLNMFYLGEDKVVTKGILERNGGFFVNDEDRAKNGKTRSYVSKRMKRGVMFYDYTIRSDKKELIKFADFINSKSCWWILIAKKSDVFVRGVVEDKGRYSVCLNIPDEMEYFLDASVLSKEINSKDLILYTNIDVTRRYLYNPDIENSELFYFLNAVYYADKKRDTAHDADKKRDTAHDADKKRDTAHDTDKKRDTARDADKKPDYEKIVIQKLWDENRKGYMFI